MAVLQPFKSNGQTSVSLTSASVATPAPVPGDGECMLVFNGTGATVAFDFGVSGAVASAASPYVLASGARMLVTVGRNGALYGVAFPLSTTTGNVYFMRGDGTTY